MKSCKLCQSKSKRLLDSVPVSKLVAVGDNDGHLGLGMKVGKEVADAIRGAIISAKINVSPVRRGYWGSRIGLPHTVPCKVSAKCGSVRVRLIPAPRGTGQFVPLHPRNC